MSKHRGGRVSERGYLAAQRQNRDKFVRDERGRPFCNRTCARDYFARQGRKTPYELGLFSRALLPRALKLGDSKDVTCVNCYAVINASRKS